MRFLRSIRVLIGDVDAAEGEANFGPAAKTRAETDDADDPFFTTESSARFPLAANVAHRLPFGQAADPVFTAAALYIASDVDLDVTLTKGVDTIHFTIKAGVNDSGDGVFYAEAAFGSCVIQASEPANITYAVVGAAPTA